MSRPEIEDRRIEEADVVARKSGVNHHYARGVIYSAIAESCKQQTIMGDSWRQSHDPQLIAQSFEYGVLRENLLTLTKAWAANYDAEYGQDRFATKLHMEFESELIATQVAKLPRSARRKLLVDLGCATGRETLIHSSHFDQSIGFDVSEDMIAVAKAKDQGSTKRLATFHVHDVEKPWPLDNGSASMIIMNNGTGSDIENLEFVLSETGRVLEDGGRFLFSFYHADAFIQQVFMPWPLSLMTEINRDRNCLEVNYDGGRLPIYARPYTIGEIGSLFRSPLVPDRVVTHPTMSSILPNELFEPSTTDLSDIRERTAAMDP